MSDRSSKELAVALDLPTNLLAHHLDLLEDVGLIERFVSAGDRVDVFSGGSDPGLEVNALTATYPTGQPIDAVRALRDDIRRCVEDLLVTLERLAA